MLKKWAFIISLIVILEAFAPIYALESYSDLEVTEAEDEGNELNEKLEEEANDDDSSSASESEEIQDAYSFIHPDKSMVVNKDNVGELILELSSYSNSHMASEEEKIQINKWLAVLEYKYKKLDTKEKRVKNRKVKDAEKAPKTPAVMDLNPNKFDSMTNKELIDAKKSITDKNEQKELMDAWKKRAQQEKNPTEREKIKKEIRNQESEDRRKKEADRNKKNEKIIKGIKETADLRMKEANRIIENSRPKTSSAENLNNANAKSSTNNSSDDVQNPSSSSANSSSTSKSGDADMNDYKGSSKPDNSGSDSANQNGDTSSTSQSNEADANDPKDFSGTSSNPNDNSPKKEIYVPIPSDPHFKKSNLEDLFAIDLTKLNPTQLNNLKNRLNQEVSSPKISTEVKKEIRLKIKDIKEVSDIRVQEIQNRGKIRVSDSEIKSKLKSGSELPQEAPKISPISKGLTSLLDSNFDGLSVERLNKLRQELASELSPKNNISNETRKEIANKIVELENVRKERTTFEHNEKQRKAEESKAKFDREEKRRKAEESKAKFDREEKQRKAEDSKTKFDGKRRKQSDEEAKTSADKGGFEQFLKSENKDNIKPAKIKIIQNRSMPTNATKSNASTNIYSIQDTVDRLRVIDISRSSSALDE